MPAGKTILYNRHKYIYHARNNIHYLVSRRVEICIDHGRIHLPSFRVTLPAELSPFDDFVIDTLDEQS